MLLGPNQSRGPVLLNDPAGFTSPRGALTPNTGNPAQRIDYISRVTRQIAV
jgi:hypothetical protein